MGISFGIDWFRLDSASRSRRRVTVMSSGFGMFGSAGGGFDVRLETWFRVFSWSDEASATEIAGPNGMGMIAWC